MSNQSIGNPPSCCCVKPHGAALRQKITEQEDEIRKLKQKPGPSATTWAEDHKLHKFWLAQCFEVWAAIPVEFRGPTTLEAGGPRTLVQKVELMAAEIEKLRAQLGKK